MEAICTAVEVAAKPSKRPRSRVTSGKRKFVAGDGHSAWGRRYLDLVAGHVADLGGADLLSEAQHSLVKRASTLEVELEMMEGRLSKGEKVDLDLYGRSLNTLRRTLESIGLRRVAHTVVPFHEYLASEAPPP